MKKFYDLKKKMEFPVVTGKSVQDASMSLLAYILDKQPGSSVYIRMFPQDYYYKTREGCFIVSARPEENADTYAARGILIPRIPENCQRLTLDPSKKPTSLPMENVEVKDIPSQVLAENGMRRRRVEK